MKDLLIVEKDALYQSCVRQKIFEHVYWQIKIPHVMRLCVELFLQCASSCQSSIHPRITDCWVNERCTSRRGLVMMVLFAWSAWQDMLDACHLPLQQLPDAWDARRAALSALEQIDDYEVFLWNEECCDQKLHLRYRVGNRVQNMRSGALYIDVCKSLSANWCICELIGLTETYYSMF